MERLHLIVEAARANSLYYKTAFAKVDHALKGQALLHALPLLKKSDMKEIQAEKPPLGGLNTRKPSGYRRLFASPGPIFEPALDGDWWRMAQALHAASIANEDIILNCFSYHLTPAGFMVEGGAFALDAAIIPAGTGNSELQAQLAAHYQATAYCGTPDFLKIILEKAEAANIPVPDLKKALVSGGALFPELRDFYKQRGITTTQCFAAADVGLIAFEVQMDGTPITDGQIIAEDVIVELIDPNSGLPITDSGVVGELVVTRLDDCFPLIRYATGDLSCWLPSPSPCGRTNQRIKGWMGRVDLTTKIRGMFVHPSQIERALAPFLNKIGAYSLMITLKDSHDAACLKLEMAEDVGLIKQIETALKEHCRITIAVEAVSNLSTPVKAIDDQRTYS